MKGRPTRAFVFPANQHAADIEKIEQFIKAACEVVCDGPSFPDAEACLRAADVLIVLICSETTTDSALAELIATASHIGKRVVGIWAPGTMDDAQLPSAFNKYGDAVIVLDPKAVKDAICGGSIIWTTPKGAIRPNPKTPRHKG